MSLTNEQLSQRLSEAETKIAHLSGLASALDFLTHDYGQDEIGPASSHAYRRREGIIALSDAMVSITRA